MINRSELTSLRLLAVCAVLTFAQGYTSAQKLSGSWKGSTRLNASEFSIILHIHPVGGTWQGTFDCPSEKAFNLSIPTIRLPTEDSVVIELTSVNAQFRGRIKRRTIVGIFSQGDRSSQLKLKRLPSSEPNAPRLQ